MIATAAIGATLGLFVLTIAATSIDRERIARGLLWLSFFGPSFLGYRENPTASAEVTGHAATRVAISVACIGIALFVSRPRWTGSTGVEVWLAIFMSVTFASVLWSSNATATLLKAIAYSLQWMALLVLVRRYESFQTFLNALAHVVHLLMLSVLVGLLLSPAAALSGAESRPRLVGLYPQLHPNMIGLLGVVALLSLATAIGPEWLRRRPYLYPGLACLYVLEMIGAYARAAMITGLLVIGVTLVREARRRVGTTLLLVAAGATAVTGIGVFFDSLVEFTRRGQNFEEFTSMSGRTHIWRAGIELWSERPWEGFGYYVGHRHDLQPFLNRGTVQSNLDSVWIELLVDQGLIGVLCMGIFLIAGTLRVHRALQQLDKSVAAFASGCIGLLVVASFYNPGLQTVSVPGVILGSILLAAVPRLESRTRRSRAIICSAR